MRACDVTFWGEKLFARAGFFLFFSSDLYVHGRFFFSLGEG